MNDEELTTKLNAAAARVQLINEKMRDAKTKEEAVEWADKYGKAIDALLDFKRERIRRKQAVVDATLAMD